MDPAVLVGSALVAGSLVVAVLALTSFSTAERTRMLANLQRGAIAAEAADPTPRGRPASVALAVRLTPGAVLSMLDRQHSRAGRPAGAPMDRLLTLKLAWVPIALLLCVLVVAGRAAPLLVVVTLLGSVIVYFLPELLLLSRGQERDQRIQKELPDTLDQMLIGVEAGLGFDAAMTRTAGNGDGPLTDELTRTLQEIRMGRSRREAFEQLAERTHVADLRQFVRAILQADAYGISVTDVLRTQAGEMRLKRRQRAEEQAQKVPVKVLMPVMLCILPVLFIVVLAPAVLDIVAAFS